MPWKLDHSVRFLNDPTFESWAIQWLNTLLPSKYRLVFRCKLYYGYSSALFLNGLIVSRFLWIVRARSFFWQWKDLGTEHFIWHHLDMDFFCRPSTTNSCFNLCHALLPYALCTYVSKWPTPFHYFHDIIYDCTTRN